MRSQGCKCVHFLLVNTASFKLPIFSYLLRTKCERLFSLISLIRSTFAAEIKL